MSPRRLKDILWVFALFGAVAVAWRVLSGLGATTDLSDDVPWGLWKVLNMIAGVALATGGFVLAFAVHVLGLKSLKPILRPAILVALLGYGSSCFALLMDIGLPDRFWHPIFHWNEHSFLFEVFWCVMLYFTVTVLEFTPIALEDSKYRKLWRFLKTISLPVVVLGITFSTMHHTSLGSLFLVSPTRIHAFWYSPLLPILFILSAIGAGCLAVTLVTLGMSSLYRQAAPVAALRKVAGAAAVILALYLGVRLADLGGRGQLSAAALGTWQGRLFLVETALLGVVPILLIAVPRIRRSTAGLALAGLFGVAGLILYRIDVGIVGYAVPSGVAAYSPTLAEIALTLGIPAAAGLVFLALAERFRIFSNDGPVADPQLASGVLDFCPQTKVWRRAFLDAPQRITLLLVIVIPIAVGLFMAQAGAASAARSQAGPPLAADAARAVLRIDADRNGVFVLFPHEDHKDRLGKDASCTLCHHLDIPNDHNTACWRCHGDMHESASIFDHDRHVLKVAEKKGATGALAGNKSCIECHRADEPRGRETAKACVECHRDDMRMAPEGGALRDVVPSYCAAMHESCVRCHDERAKEAGKPLLGECGTCHR